MTEHQIDIIKGVFYGQAIGDALGLGTEFLDKSRLLNTIQTVYLTTNKSFKTNIEKDGKKEIGQTIQINFYVFVILLF